MIQDFEDIRIRDITTRMKKIELKNTSFEVPLHSIWYGYGESNSGCGNENPES